MGSGPSGTASCSCGRWRFHGSRRRQLRPPMRSGRHRRRSSRRSGKGGGSRRRSGCFRICGQRRRHCCAAPARSRSSVLVCGPRRHGCSTPTPRSPCRRSVTSSEHCRSSWVSSGVRRMRSAHRETFWRSSRSSCGRNWLSRRGGCSCCRRRWHVVAMSTPSWQHDRLTSGSPRKQRSVRALRLKQLAPALGNSKRSGRRRLLGTAGSWRGGTLTSATCSARWTP
mmetsp:Transcript_10932/g.32931  ORF Transcript_10932/g.32931 Transcript_10932/m.32931 type:complete len:225 (+) Transcript_10932:443-1117(+)